MDVRRTDAPPERKVELMIKQDEVERLSPGQLWSRKASGHTHRITAMAGGLIYTRSVEGGVQAGAEKFLEAFDWIEPDAEKTLRQPKNVKRRQGRVKA